MANDALNELLHLGIESVAEAVCTAMGLYVAGSAGAVGGAAATPLLAKGLKNVLVDVAVRQMSDREKYRVGTAAAHAVNEIYRRLINGDKPRQDGFFESLDDDRSPAETILDGVLTESRQQWEEKKVPWIANIFVNSAFLDVEPLTVYRVITMAERMSWRQFVILSLAARDPDPGLPYSWIRTTQNYLPLRRFCVRRFWNWLQGRCLCSNLIPSISRQWGNCAFN